MLRGELLRLEPWVPKWGGGVRTLAQPHPCGPHEQVRAYPLIWPCVDGQGRRRSWGRGVGQVWREGSSLPVGPPRRLHVFLLGLSSRTPEHRKFRGGLDGETLDLFSRPVWPQVSQNPWVGSPSDRRAAGRRRPEPLSCQPLQSSAGGWRAEQGGGPSSRPRSHCGAGAHVP